MGENFLQLILGANGPHLAVHLACDSGDELLLFRTFPLNTLLSVPLVKGFAKSQRFYISNLKYLLFGILGF